MRLLVLGGTVFLSREVAAEALRRGHDVVCACRGTSGPVPDGARLVRWDREEDPPAELTGGYDAVVDVARQPSHVRRAVAAVPDAHWVFVSTLNVYADEATPGGRPGALPLRDPIETDVDLGVDPEAYGGMKVACERAVREGTASWTVVRPGLIAGPGDPSGRFAYWPRRLASGGEVLAPGDPGDVVQLIDVRDLAAWIVTLAERRTGGDFDGVGRPAPIADLLHACAPDADLTWVPQEFLAERGVEPWAGPGSVPLWLPRPDYDGMMSHEVQPSLDAGLELRPAAGTARDTLAWLEADPDAPVTGIDRAREAELLAAWRSRRPA
ncbi:NAD-dependent epimerase/dehydratase family protein [Nocardioides sp. TF02-7]|uniref:NAD-dependent epimerase/dehydratase family protein n=1 Tax=Nocardioides sp. TF02-7 TaxID=2917724 RepID=UPI001F0519EC|nr:NAD-dependent epimerase/dehydratase family protein [Nocardioides sp. TF02-7]UMG92825.1 NAD-dependent epimerase/dehydratase family protein [Nocardioides sp. TF02-7]